MEWAEAKLEYAKTDRTHAEIAEQFGCGVQAVKEHSRKEGWREARQNYRRKLEVFLDEKEQFRYEVLNEVEELLDRLQTKALAW